MQQSTNSFRDVIPPLHRTCLPQVIPVNRQFHPLTAGNISQSHCLHCDEYFVYVSPSCLIAVSGYLSSKHNNRYLLLSLSPPTTLQAFALCLAWQQCEVNRMNKTYLNQSPLPWEMSSCQYSLMGKHKACPKGWTVYHVAPTKMQWGQLVPLYMTNTQTLPYSKQSLVNTISCSHFIHSFYEWLRWRKRECMFLYGYYICLLILLHHGAMIQSISERHNI